MIDISNIWFLQTSCLVIVTISVTLVLGLFLIFIHLCFGCMMTLVMLVMMVITYIVTTGLIHTLLLRSEAINLSIENIVRLLDSLKFIHPLQSIKPGLKCLLSLDGSEDDENKQDSYLENVIANIDWENSIGR